MKPIKNKAATLKRIEQAIADAEFSIKTLQKAHKALKEDDHDPMELTFIADGDLLDSLAHLRPIVEPKYKAMKLPYPIKK